MAQRSKAPWKENFTVIEHGICGIYIYMVYMVCMVYIILYYMVCIYIYMTGWWLLLTPLKNDGVKVSWDDDSSQLNGKS